MAEKNAKIIIDQRPILVVFWARTYRFWILSFIGLLFFWFLQSTPFTGLSPEAYKALGAFLLCTVLWLTQLIPLPVTGLLAVVIIPVLGILPSKEVFGYFGNEAVFFILGAFILAAAIMKTGLSTRLSLFFLKQKKMTPHRLTFQILLTTSILSCLMSEHAVAAFVFPIVLQISRALEFEPFGGEYGKTLFLAMAWGCIIGGIVTFLGGARAPLALGILKEISGDSIGFFEWMKTTLPLAIPLFVTAYGVLRWYFKTDVESVDTARMVLEQKRKEIGRISFDETIVLLTLMGAIFFWMVLGESKGMANIAIVASVILFVFGVVSWKDVEEYVNWGVILMYGGAISLGRAVDQSGALEWIAQQVIMVPQIFSENFGGSSAFWLVASLSILSVFLTELFSNAAVVALLLPISIKMAASFGVVPESMTYAIAIMAGLGFIMPMGTPAMAIAYSSGYLKIKDIALPGLFLNVIAWVYFVLIIKFWWPYLNIHL